MEPNFAEIKREMNQSKHGLKALMGTINYFTIKINKLQSHERNIQISKDNSQRLLKGLKWYDRQMKTILRQQQHLVNYLKYDGFICIQNLYTLK